MPSSLPEDVLVSIFKTVILCINGRYIPDAANAIYDVLKEVSQFHATKKRRFEEEDAQLLQNIHSRTITNETLKEKLAQFVEKVRHELKIGQLLGNLCSPTITASGSGISKEFPVMVLMGVHCGYCIV